MSTIVNHPNSPTSILLYMLLESNLKVSELHIVPSPSISSAKECNTEKVLESRENFPQVWVMLKSTAQARLTYKSTAAGSGQIRIRQHSSLKRFEPRAPSSEYMSGITLFIPPLQDSHFFKPTVPQANVLVGQISQYITPRYVLGQQLPLIIALVNMLNK